MSPDVNVNHQGFIVALNECMLKITRGHHRGCGGRGRGHRPPAPHHRREGDPGEQSQLKQVLRQDIPEGKRRFITKPSLGHKVGNIE